MEITAKETVSREAQFVLDAAELEIRAQILTRFSKLCRDEVDPLVRAANEALEEKKKALDKAEEELNKTKKKRERCEKWKKHRVLSTVVQIFKNVFVGESSAFSIIGKMFKNADNPLDNLNSGEGCVGAIFFLVYGIPLLLALIIIMFPFCLLISLVKNIVLGIRDLSKPVTESQNFEDKKIDVHIQSIAALTKQINRLLSEINECELQAEKAKLLQTQFFAVADACDDCTRQLRDGLDDICEKTDFLPPQYRTAAHLLIFRHAVGQSYTRISDMQDYYKRDNFEDILVKDAQSIFEQLKFTTRLAPTIEVDLKRITEKSNEFLRNCKTLIKWQTESAEDVDMAKSCKVFSYIDETAALLAQQREKYLGA